MLHGLESCKNKKDRIVHEEHVLSVVLVISREGGVEHGKLAIFSCVERRQLNGPNWRVALVHQRKGNMSALSNSFGLFLRSLDALEAGMFTPNEYEEKWTYIGPNCSKVVRKNRDLNTEVSPCNFWCICVTQSVLQKSVVLRSYDNRCIQTPRSVIVYEQWKKIRKKTQLVRPDYQFNSNG